MKYIRTKDGIYEVINGCVLDTKLKWWQLERINKNEGKFYIDGIVVCERVADTIEEFCDEFVYQIDKYHYYNDELEIAKGLCDDITKIYGAIWTDKGLIYVAKMNEKGELELL